MFRRFACCQVCSRFQVCRVGGSVARSPRQSRLQHDLPDDGVQRVLTENRDIKARRRQLTRDNRLLTERLAGARDNNRFLDSIARQEAELAERMAMSGAST
jgi:hypothetical protein